MLEKAVVVGELGAIFLLFCKKCVSFVRNLDLIAGGFVARYVPRQFHD